MSKTFRAWRLDDSLLLPPSIRDFVPADHLSRFVVTLVKESLDLKAVYASYQGEKGQPPYDPAMMVALLLYAYAVGIYSSRRIAKACAERTDFLMLVALDAPDFRTISEFRRRHLRGLSDLFVQVLRLCQAAGLVKLGHVALDGTKIKANASKHKAMSYAHMSKREKELEAEVARWLAAASAADAEEDAAYGRDKRGDEMPDWVKDKERRLAKIRQAKAALEAEAKAAAEEKSRADAEAQERYRLQGRKRPGKKPTPPRQVPEGKTQRNFTDAESRILKTKDGFIQGYNAQAAVDSHDQIIVAHDLIPGQSDQGQLVPLVDAIEACLGKRPKEASADAGYCSESNLEALGDREINAYIATGRQKHSEATAAGERRSSGPLTKIMQAKLRRAGRRSRYRLRKQVVEPVFGQIKHARGFRQFLLRGVEKVSAEWAMICTTHNLLKLAKAA